MTAVLAISDVRKNYAALRPLRINALTVERHERVALGGLDGAATELLVNLITGASLPDEGTIATFGRATTDITDGEAWLAWLERFGIVSQRAVLLEGSTLEQNLALPFTLEIDALPPSVTAQVRALAADCGIDGDALPRQIGDLPPHVRARAHLARALALNPELLLVEHPSAEVAESERAALARDFAGAIGRRGASALIMTLDLDFAEAAAHRSLTLEAATGALVPWKKKRGWFR